MKDKDPIFKIRGSIKKPTFLFAVTLVIVVVINSDLSLAQDPLQERSSVSTGRYLVSIAGCNDCHTKGWTATEAKVPEQEWLTGDVLGWTGPWGTTYPQNLRLLISNLSEDNWVRLTRKMQARPPMPWWALRRMTDTDVRSIYRFVNNLGPKGEPSPAYLPPDIKPKPPYFLLVTE